jgi:ribose 5-phosphate isomerase B
VIVFGARIIGSALAYDLADTFIKAKFIFNEDRFVRRFNKVKAIEARYMCGQGSTSKA